MYDFKTETSDKAELYRQLCDAADALTRRRADAADALTPPVCGAAEPVTRQRARVRTGPHRCSRFGPHDTLDPHPALPALAAAARRPGHGS